MENAIRTLFWKDDAVVMIDQQALPREERYVTCTDYREVIAAINNLTVRGAPAIGVAAAMGIALGVLHLSEAAPDSFRRAFEGICTEFAATRPTARNLFWAIERMKSHFEALLPAAASAIPSLAPAGTPVDSSPGDASGRIPGKGTGLYSPPEACFLTDGQASRLFAARRRSPAVAESLRPPPPEESGARPPERSADPWQGLRESLTAEAIRIGEEDIAINRRLGRNGRDLIPEGARILTHCNAGALATAGYGTALGVIRAAREQGKALRVYADETRPVLQGARLTAWELMREGIPCTLIADNMAGFLMQQKRVDLVIVGADRIAGNGDTANKIGTYGLAVLARTHGIPFYVAAPLSTIDPALPDGRSIPIEERNPDEMTQLGGVRTAPEGIAVWNPAFDVTPGHLITAIITEAGLVRPPFAAGIQTIF